MATSRSRTTTTTSRRATSRSTGRRSAAADNVEVVEESGGMDLDAGLGIVTCLLLIIALVLVDYEMGTQLGAGILFK